jgi:hypothetical protein
VLARIEVADDRMPLVQPPVLKACNAFVNAGQEPRIFDGEVAVS